MAKTVDVVIIGAGVMGASIAFNLARRGISNVAVLEKNFIAAGATGKSSACVRQHYSTEVGARMVMRSLEIFQNFSEIVGGPAGFVKTGYLMGVGERDHQALKKVIAMQQAVGIKTSLLSPKEIREIEPRVSIHDLAAGAWEPDSGYADPSDTTNAFMRRAREMGVRLCQNTQVTGLKATAGAIASERGPACPPRPHPAWLSSRQHRPPGCRRGGDLPPPCVQLRFDELRSADA